MTEQEALAKVWQWFVVDGNPRSVDASGTCMYRGENGCKCAVGVLIPNNQYSDEYEGNPPALLVEEFGVPALRGLSSDFLRALQCAHDNLYAPAQNARVRRPPVELTDQQKLEWCLREIATGFGLTVPT